MSGSIRDYFHVKDGHPDPRGSLSSQLPSQAIALANKEVERELRETGNSVKRQRHWPWHFFSPTGASSSLLRELDRLIRAILQGGQNFVVQTFS